MNARKWAQARVGTAAHLFDGYDVVRATQDIESLIVKIGGVRMNDRIVVGDIEVVGGYCTAQPVEVLPFIDASV